MASYRQLLNTKLMSSVALALEVKEQAAVYARGLGHVKFGCDIA